MKARGALVLELVPDSAAALGMVDDVHRRLEGTAQQWGAQHRWLGQ